MTTETCYFTFGRFNPPTIGHEKLLDRLVSEAGADDVMIFPTKTYDKRKNPLKFVDKVNWMKLGFPNHKKLIVDDEACCRTIITTCQHMMMLDYTSLVMVVGQDRVTEFDTLLQKRNRTDDFSFDKITVVSAGIRDPDAEGAEGMSASKLRDFAKEEDAVSFMDGLSDELDTGQKMEIFTQVRAGLGL